MMAKIRTNHGDIEVRDGTNLGDACEKIGLNVVCRVGVCGLCQLRVVAGQENLTELTQPEIDKGMDKDNRLACQCSIKSGEIEVSF
ncbi:MAG TPA: 2Fe-2S iron-sulfur cluster-binding protein [Candidatus Nanoarchaeia archaeon]|nr:2Fe-2S iron-sulfur cluster-binding protein [Candidatus Nanoarchaeia archaeon]